MARKKSVRRVKKQLSPKECYFCKESKSPTFVEADVLRRYLSERGKIIGRSRNGLCALHQRRLSTEIKHARHLALLPFVVRE